VPIASAITKPAAFRTEDQPMCVVCNLRHPNGLRIKYETTAGGEVTANWLTSSGWAGFPGIIHGGIVSTVLDEAMSKAVASTGCRALTAELRVRFRGQVSPGEDLVIRGWIVARTRRLFRAEASLKAGDGTERAHAWATFLPPPNRPTTVAGKASRNGTPGAVAIRAEVFYCPGCNQEIGDPVVCRDCTALICRVCGSPVEGIDDLGIG